MDIFGDKWTLLVIRDLFLGRRFFHEFQSSPEKIASNILTNRLERLAEHGIVDSQPVKEGRARKAYRLTDKGSALGPVLHAIKEWGEANIEGAEARMKKV